MEHRVKVTVLDKKLFPDLQAEYCAAPDSGRCPCFNTGDEFMFYRNGSRDDFWHMGAGRLSKAAGPMKTCCCPPTQSIAEKTAFLFARRPGTRLADIFIRRCRAEPSCAAG